MSLASRAAAVLGLCVVFSCAAETSNDTIDHGEDDSIVLAFNVWSCTDLTCLDLETSETSTQSYTACAAVESDAREVGISLCEGKKRGSTVVSQDATCKPLGTACPVTANRKAALWSVQDTRDSADAGDDG